MFNNEFYKDVVVQINRTGVSKMSLSKVSKSPLRIYYLLECEGKTFEFEEQDLLFFAFKLAENRFQRQFPRVCRRVACESGRACTDRTCRFFTTPFNRMRANSGAERSISKW